MERSSSTIPQTHIFFVPNIKGLAETVLTWEGKVFADADADEAETDWKHKVTPERGDLITEWHVFCLNMAAILNFRGSVTLKSHKIPFFQFTFFMPSMMLNIKSLHPLSFFFSYLNANNWTLNDLYFQPAESIPRCMFGTNLVIPAQICDELLSG